MKVQNTQVNLEAIWEVKIKVNKLKYLPSNL